MKVLCASYLFFNCCFGSVDRVVAADSRGPWFESCHRQNFKLNIFCWLYWKDEKKRTKREGIRSDAWGPSTYFCTLFTHFTKAILDSIIERALPRLPTAFRDERRNEHNGHIQLNDTLIYTKIVADTSGQSYNGSTIVNYDSRGVPD